MSEQVLTAQNIRSFSAFLDNASDKQLQGIYDRERAAGRAAYVELVKNEARSRGVDLRTWGGQ